MRYTLLTNGPVIPIDADADADAQSKATARAILKRGWTVTYDESEYTFSTADRTKSKRVRGWNMLILNSKGNPVRGATLTVGDPFDFSEAGNASAV